MATLRKSESWRASFEPFRQRNFFLVWCAGLISVAGDWMLKIALPILVFELTGSVAATSGVVVASLVPTLLFGSAAGVFVDRWDRRRVMLVASLAQALAVLPLVAVDGPGTIWIVYAVGFAGAGLAQLFRPAEAALLPLLVPTEQLFAANSLNAVNNNLARLVGPALGGVVAAWAGLAAVAFVDAGTFVLAAVLLCLVRGRFVATEPVAAGTVVASDPAPVGMRTAVGAVWREFVDGLAFVRGSRVLSVLIATFTLTSIGEGLMGALFAVYVKQGLHGGVREVGWLMSAQAVGGVVGGLVGGWFGTRFSPVRLISVGAVIFGFLDVVLFAYPLLAPVLWPALVLFVLVGVPGMVMNAAVMAEVQIAAPNRLRGRVFAFSGTTMGLASMLGAGIAAGFGASIGPMLLLILQGAGYIVAGVVVARLLAASRMPAVVESPAAEKPTVEAQTAARG